MPNGWTSTRSLRDTRITSILRSSTSCLMTRGPLQDLHTSLYLRGWCLHALKHMSDQDDYLLPCFYSCDVWYAAYAHTRSNVTACQGTQQRYSYPLHPPHNGFLLMLRALDHLIYPTPSPPTATPSMSRRQRKNDFPPVLQRRGGITSNMSDITGVYRHHGGKKPEGTIDSQGHRRKCESHGPWYSETNANIPQSVGRRIALSLRPHRRLRSLELPPKGPNLRVSRPIMSRQSQL